jgi:hypothetical protein
MPKTSSLAASKWQHHWPLLFSPAKAPIYLSIHPEDTPQSSHQHSPHVLVVESCRVPQIRRPSKIPFHYVLRDAMVICFSKSQSTTLLCCRNLASLVITTIGLVASLLSTDLHTARLSSSQDGSQNRPNISRCARRGRRKATPHGPGRSLHRPQRRKGFASQTRPLDRAASDVALPILVPRPSKLIPHLSSEEEKSEVNLS